MVLQYDWGASLPGMLQLSVVPKLVPGFSESPYTAATWPASATYAYQLPSMAAVIATALPSSVTSGGVTVPERTLSMTAISTT